MLLIVIRMVFGVRQSWILKLTPLLPNFIPLSLSFLICKLEKIPTSWVRIRWGGIIWSLQHGDCSTSKNVCFFIYPTPKNRIKFFHILILWCEFFVVINYSHPLYLRSHHVFCLFVWICGVLNSWALCNLTTDYFSE